MEESEIIKRHIMIIREIPQEILQSTRTGLSEKTGKFPVLLSDKPEHGMTV